MKTKKSYTKIINIGTSSSNKNELNKRIKLVNITALLWYFAFILTSILTVIFRGFNSPILKVNLIGLAIISTCIFFNKSQKYTLAAFGVLLYTIFHYTFLSCFISPERFVEFFFVFVPPLSLLFFENYKFSWVIFFLSVISFHIPFLGFNFYKSDTILFLPPLLFFLFAVNFIIVLYFKKLNVENEHLLAIERDKVLGDKIILENQQRELKELNEFKSHFFVNLSHEIRTPLTLIQGYASKIDLEDSKEKNKEQIEVISDQASQIQSIINNIMDLSKMDTNQFHLNTNWTPISLFFKKHYGNFKGLFETKEINFTLSDSTEKLAFNIDEDLFSKSINNLLNNAFKFTPKKGTVKLSISTKNEDLIIEISDTGIGIPEVDLEKVFERFYQSKNHITKSQGSGIGLSFTKSIIENHGFEIQLKSKPNVNTTFKITIPKEAIQEIDIETEDFTLINPVKTINTVHPKEDLAITSKRILVVDDHKQMRSYIASLLSEYEIIQAENGKEALEIMELHSFDLIITDYMMPVIDGEALVNTLKEKEVKTPIIVLTARTDNTGKLNMLRLGIDGYLNKPFLEEELIIHVKKSIRSYNVINSFDAKLESEEKKNLNRFAQKFNENLRVYINTNLTSNQLSVESIAEHFEMSKSTLNRKVKSLLGQTTQELIMEVRFEKARQLRSTNPYETRKSLANSVGISNASYFFKKMEERFGKAYG